MARLIVAIMNTKQWKSHRRLWCRLEDVVEVSCADMLISDLLVLRSASAKLEPNMEYQDVCHTSYYRFAIAKEIFFNELLPWNKCWFWVQQLLNHVRTKARSLLYAVEACKVSIASSIKCDVEYSLSGVKTCRIHCEPQNLKSMQASWSWFCERERVSL
jgi:hypothetical protein